MSNPASSRGSTFNGGTITQPLVIATTDGNVVPLSVQAGWNAQAPRSDRGTHHLRVDLRLLVERF